MSDYYSYRDTKRTEPKYETTGTGGWLWPVVVLVALVALFAIGSSGGAVDDGAVDGAPAAVATDQ